MSSEVIEDLVEVFKIIDNNYDVRKQYINSNFREIRHTLKHCSKIRQLRIIKQAIHLSEEVKMQPKKLSQCLKRIIMKIQTSLPSKGMQAQAILESKGINQQLVEALKIKMMEWLKVDKNCETILIIVMSNFIDYIILNDKH